ncbi:MAG: DNA-processing protein DprA [Thermoleophilia bacterium]
MSIVGSRRATSYGREVARSLGHELATAGRTVISGWRSAEGRDESAAA